MSSEKTIQNSFINYESATKYNPHLLLLLSSSSFILVLVNKEIAPKVVLLLGRTFMLLGVILLGVICWLAKPDRGSDDDVSFYIITISMGFIMMVVIIY